MPGLLVIFGKRLLPLILLLVCSSHLHAQPRIKVRDLLRDKTQDKVTVVVEGEVSSINYAPEIRDGMSVLSFVLDDGTGKVKILNQTAGMLTRGDRVRVVGVFARSRELAGYMKPANEIDSTRGEIEVLKGKRAEEIRESRERGVTAIPTSLVDTPWSLTIGIATLLSAIFAAIATIPLVLRARRFNLAMKIMAPSPGLVERTRGESIAVFRPILRLISTGSMTPQLSREFILKIGAQKFQSQSLRILERAEEIVFPVAVENSITLELDCEIPDSLCEEVPQGYSVIFRDTFTGQHFKARIISSIAESVVDKSRIRPTHHLRHTEEAEARVEGGIVGSSKEHGPLVADAVMRKKRGKVKKLPSPPRAPSRA